MKYKSLFILLYFWLLIESQKWNSNQWLLMLFLFQFWRLKLEILINQFIFKFLIFDFISWWNFTSQKIGCWGSPFLKRFPPVPSSHLQPGKISNLQKKNPMVNSTNFAIFFVKFRTKIDFKKWKTEKKILIHRSGGLGRGSVLTTPP